MENCRSCKNKTSISSQIKVIEVPLPYTDRAITAEVTPGIVAPVYPPRAEYPPESSANPEYPPEVYTPPEGYEQAQVALNVQFHIILIVEIFRSHFITISSYV